MGFWIVAQWIFTGLSVLYSITRKPKIVDDKQRATAPTSKEGNPIKVVYGSVLVENPNVLWWGQPEKKVFQGGVTTRYIAGAALGICAGPVDNVRNILWDGKDISQASHIHSTTYGRRFEYYNFGDETTSNALEGYALVYFGGTSQTVDPYLAANIGSYQPRWKRICYCVLADTFYSGASFNSDGQANPGHGILYGASSIMPSPSFMVDAWPAIVSGMTAGHHKIASAEDPTGNHGYDANAACMIYHAMTDGVFMGGVDAADLDLTSLAAMGETLYTEGFGLSMQFDTSQDCDDVVGEILRHVDGVRYREPSTGKYVFKLIREDYTTGALTVLDNTNSSACIMQRPGWEQTVNITNVIFTDRLRGFTDRARDYQDAANIWVRDGDIHSEDIRFPGITSATNADLTAYRVGRVQANPLAQFTITSNRAAYLLRPGDPFKVTWPDFGVSALVCRVTNIRTGSLLKGEINIDAVEDVFQTPYAVTDPGEPPVDPGSYPRVGWAHAEEAPFIVSGTTACKIMVLVARNASALAVGVDSYGAYEQPEGGSLNLRLNGQTNFCPRAVLSKELAIGATDSAEFINLAEEAVFDAWKANLSPQITSSATITAISGKTLTATLAEADHTYDNGIAYSRGGEKRFIKTYAAGQIILFSEFSSGQISTSSPNNLVPLSKGAIHMNQTLVLVGDEIVAFTIVQKPANGQTGKMFALARGVDDTAPKTWPVGTPIWFINAGAALYSATLTNLLPVDLGSDTFANHRNENRQPPNYSVFIVAHNSVTTSRPMEMPSCWSPRPVPAFIDAHDRFQSYSTRGARPPCPCDLKINGVNYPANFSGDASLSCAPRSRDGTGLPTHEGFRSGAQDHLVASGPAEKIVLEVWPELLIDQGEATIGSYSVGYDYSAPVEIRHINSELTGGGTTGPEATNSPRFTENYGIVLDTIYNTSYTFLWNGSTIYGTGLPSSVVRFDLSTLNFQSDAQGNSPQSYQPLSYKASRSPLPTSGAAPKVTFINAHAGSPGGSPATYHWTSGSVSVATNETLVLFAAYQIGQDTITPYPSFGSKAFSPVQVSYTAFTNLPGETGVMQITAFAYTATEDATDSVDVYFVGGGSPGAILYKVATIGAVRPPTHIANSVNLGSSMSITSSKIATSNTLVLAAFVRDKVTGDQGSNATWPSTWDDSNGAGGKAHFGISLSGTDKGYSGAATATIAASMSAPADVGVIVTTGEPASGWCMLLLGFDSL
jgi:hypothetical protein